MQTTSRRAPTRCFHIAATALLPARHCLVRRCPVRRCHGTSPSAHCCCRTAPRPPGAGRRAPLALPVLACRGHARQCHARRCHARRAGHARHVATCTHAAPGLLPLLSSRHHQSRMHSCRIAQNHAIARRVRCVVNRAVIVYRVTSRRISRLYSNLVGSRTRDGFARCVVYVYISEPFVSPMLLT